MSRGRGADGVRGRRARAQDEYEPGGWRGDPEDLDQDPAGDGWGRSTPPWDRTGPPWEQPGWDDTTGSLPGVLPGSLPPGHPSGPLPMQRLSPAASGALPPLPPLPPTRSRRTPPAGTGYRDGRPGGPAGDGYPGREYPPEDGYAERGHPGGYSDAGYPGDGYAGDGYADEDYDEYEDYDDEYEEEYEDSGDGQGAEDWYDDPDAEDGYDEEFLPGLNDGARHGGTGQGRRRAQARARSGGRAPRKRRGMRRVAPWLALGVVLVLVGGVGGAGYYYWTRYLHPPDYSGQGTGSVVVQIKPGDTATAVGIRLQQLGVVASARAFSNAAKASSQGSSLEPGYYRVHRHMQASLAFALLLKPSSRVVYKVVIPEGLRLSEIITVLGQKTHDPAGYQRAIKKPSVLGLPAYAGGNPQGYLFPATYPVQPGTPPVQVLRAMVQRFGQEAASVHLTKVAKIDQVTPKSVIIIASLIQAEGMRPQDLPKIARVIYNRLNAHMKLQLDSTVRFAMKSHVAHLSQADTQFKSPYNTYLQTGLPPGPIDSPGDAAIRAALHPAKGGWLYFLTVNKAGDTKFAYTYSQFQQLEAQAGITG